MNYTQTLNYIHSLGNFSLPPTLDRIKKVLEILNNPQNSFKSVHIAGTNGKGSVSAMLASIFKTAGCKTGLFISPFIIDFTERIQINGEFISENDLIKYSEIVKNTNISLTEFEFITALAFLYFKENGIDILICETGLGGRLDATNTLENLAATVITKIGLDHTGILGDTIEKITKEKCGILRDCPNITSPYQQEEALEVIKNTSKELIIPEISKLKTLENNTFIYKDKKYELLLVGDYQIENSLIAIETALNSGYDISYDLIYEGLKNTYFPARTEVISKKPLVVLDGAHNIDGALAVSKELSKHGGEVTAIIGMCKDKDYEEFLKTTLKYCKNAVAVEIENMPRSLKREELLGTAEKYCKCTLAQNYTEAIQKAVALSDKKPIFVFGSLYLASGIRPSLKKYFN